MGAGLAARLSLLLSVTILSPMVSAHPGGLDDNGGHVDWRTGEYHCHRPGCLPRDHDPSQYSRRAWAHWLDLFDGCLDVRQAVLLRDAAGPVVVDGCRVVAGQWVDAYSGEAIEEPATIDVDHLIPLAWAHERGGWEWGWEMRRAFANDPDNLATTTSSLNRSKGARGPAEWLPPGREGAQCRYLTQWESVMSRYGLAYAVEEQEAVEALHQGMRCGASER